MFVKGTFIYTPAYGDVKVKENNYLHIVDGIVDKFYDKIPEEFAGEELVDYGDNIIIPAFNDLHVHAPQYLNRGLGYDDELLPWLEKYTFPLEGRFMKEEFALKAYTLFLNDLINSGTMRFAAFATIHKHATKLLMELTNKTGMKAYIGKVNMDRNSPDYLCEDREKSISDTCELIEWTKNQENVKYILTPRFVPSVTPELMRALGDLAEKYNLPVQSHVSENPGEISWVKSLHPDIESYTAVYREYGLLRKGQTILAHGIHLTDNERKIIKDNNIYIAHCPQSNVDLSSGIMRLDKYVKDGIKCALASDVSGGHTVAMNRHIITAVEMSKANTFYNPEDGFVTLKEAFYLATKGSGSFFGKVGSFEPDYEFDALVLDTKKQPELIKRSALEKLWLFLYDGSNDYIIDRYCDGKIVTPL